MNNQSPDFESIKQISPHGAEYWSARSLGPLLGYTKWQNYERLVQRALNLIRTGAASGRIVETGRRIVIGKGAVREVLDYQLDNDALNLLKELASSYKLTKHYSVRNETVLLTLLEKYCNLRSIKFRFQQKLGDYVFDCLIADYIAVEFDEFHHQDRRTQRRDRKKEVFARSLGLLVIRFDMSNDVVDMIVEIEKCLDLHKMQLR
jgi:very-short-patch-repair endonuclease